MYYVGQISEKKILILILCVIVHLRVRVFEHFVYQTLIFTSAQNSKYPIKMVTQRSGITVLWSSNGVSILSALFVPG